MVGNRKGAPAVDITERLRRYARQQYYSDMTQTVKYYLGDEAADEIERLRNPQWTCGARKQGTAGGNDPADCNWPMCGCDPYAAKVIHALDECGHLK
jgi:hypothetical protein